MAITFISQLEDQNGGSNWLAVNSPIVMRWTDDTNPGDIEYGEIEVSSNYGDDVYTRLVPDNAGVLRFDLREALISVMEDIDQNSPGYIDNLEGSSDLYTFVTVTAKAFVGNTLIASDAIGFYVSRATMQGNRNFQTLSIQDNPFTELFQLKDGAIQRRVLLPGVGTGAEIDDDQKITIFTGYPQTVSIISAHQTGNGQEISVNGEALGQVNEIGHILISDGSSIPTHISGGTPGVLEITGDAMAESAYLYYKRKDECGIYLRWLNDQGGYSYFLFSKVFQSSEEVKAVDVINVTVDDLGGNRQAQVTGFEGQSVTTIIASELEQYEVNILQSLYKSINVCMYTGSKGDYAGTVGGNSPSDGTAKWSPIIISPGRWIVEDTKRKLYKMAFTINKMPLNYQSI